MLIVTGHTITGAAYGDIANDDRRGQLRGRDQGRAVEMLGKGRGIVKGHRSGIGIG